MEEKEEEVVVEKEEGVVEEIMEHVSLHKLTYGHRHRHTYRHKLLVLLFLLLLLMLLLLLLLAMIMVVLRGRTKGMRGMHEVIPAMEVQRCAASIKAIIKIYRSTSSRRRPV